ncbi:MAG: ABC transporter substrate-binding protein [Alphaproteobacteria bacterium]|nr:ABC transporter substrate-binding protein [Alphaproteobacteria bacterium]
MNKTSKPFIKEARGSICRVVATGLTVSSIALAGLVGSVQTSVADNVVRCAYPFRFGFAAAPVADAMGYYEEEGIEFEAVFDNDRANVLPGLESGEINCTMRTIGEHISRPMSADSNLVVIGLIDISVGADGVVGAPEIDSVTDLVGKTFAGEINHPGTVMTAFALKQAGYSLDDIDMRMIATDDSPAIFEDPDVAAVATWEPMLSEIVANTSRTGSKILLSSKDFNGLITDVVIVNRNDYEANKEKYDAFMRGIYRAVDLFNSDPDKFLELAAPGYDVTPEQMAVDLAGVYYTSYEDAVEYFGTDGSEPRLKQIVEDLTVINLDLDLMDEAIPYEFLVDASTTEDLFEGKTR